ncbi:hypothetical protein ACXC9Q_22320 [Kribbella sp. CWNU-51]
MPTLRRRDLVASTLIAVLVTLYLLFLASSNFLTIRAMTCATLMLGGAIIILCSDGERPDAISWLTTILAVTAVGAGRPGPRRLAIDPLPDRRHRDHARCVVRPARRTPHLHLSGGTR